MMKNLIMISVLFPFLVFAQLPSSSPYDQLRDFNSVSVLAGGHLSVVYEGSTTLTAGDQDTTQWLLVGYAPGVSKQDLVKIGTFGPAVFTLLIRLTSSGDSVGLSEVAYQFALDTTSTVYIHADTTNRIMYDGAFSSVWYGQWAYEDIKAPTPSTGYMFPVRVWCPGYIRFLFTSTGVVDETTVQWKLVGTR